jgi:hypothetical protein
VKCGWRPHQPFIRTRPERGSPLGAATLSAVLFLFLFLVNLDRRILGTSTFSNFALTVAVA